MNLVQCHCIRSTGGGLKSFRQLEMDLVKDLHEHDAVVSTMVDLYALPVDFPNYQEALRLADHQKRVVFLENSLKEYFQSKLDMNLSHFVPNIQLHEFESLIFSSERGFELFDEKDLSLVEIKKILSMYPNPETINDGKETAPSKRLLRCVQGYNKILDGNAMIERIGFRTVMEKCPHFSAWVNQVVAVLSQKD